MNETFTFAQLVIAFLLGALFISLIHAFLIRRALLIKRNGLYKKRIDALAERMKLENHDATNA